MIETSALELCRKMVSELDGKEIYRLTKSDLEEWKRTYTPKPEYRKDYKAVHLHGICGLVLCQIEPTETES